VIKKGSITQWQDKCKLPSKYIDATFYLHQGDPDCFFLRVKNTFSGAPKDKEISHCTDFEN
jgi:hypothetical protein